ncbi:MAG: ROK family protein [Firmicutes bacterium]|nr:ROK family protein [Bacillota bacterium]
MKHYIGIDIGGMSCKAGVVNEKGEIVFRGSCPTKANAHYSEIIKDIADLTTEVIKNAGLSLKDIQAVGMGIPGTIDSENGVIVYSNNISFKKVPVIKEFKKHIKLPVFIGNDANCAALGEVVFGSAKGLKDIVFITLGTGVGSGIILNGKIFAGKGGSGAEAGHMVIISGGDKCTCGRKGCWEAYASASALIKLTERMAKKEPLSRVAQIIKADGKASGETAFKASKEGDKLGQKIVAKYAKYVSDGIVNLVNIFRPDAVLVGGGISNQGDYFIDMLAKQADKASYGGKINPRPVIKSAGLLNDAGILGAVSLCFEETK